MGDYAAAMLRSPASHPTLIRVAALALFVGATATATAQEPSPGQQTHSATPGSFGVVVDTAEVHKAERVRIAVRCFKGDVPCEGTLKITSLNPVLYGHGHKRRTITIAEGPIGTIPAGEGRYVNLPLSSSARKRMRLFKNTPSLWQPYWPDGTSMTVPRSAITLISDAAS
jgi:hypothetical protein